MSAAAAAVAVLLPKWCSARPAFCSLALPMNGSDKQQRWAPWESCHTRQRQTAQQQLLTARRRSSGSKHHSKHQQLAPNAAQQRCSPGGRLCRAWVPFLCLLLRLLPLQAQQDPVSLRRLYTGTSEKPQAAVVAGVAAGRSCGCHCEAAQAPGRLWRCCQPPAAWQCQPGMA